ncbi:MAG TPA: PAS domain-containing sensor histidine kinase [Rhizomicrobium sp.]|nr:PAS domain-containing sensor histidine kinase [Rhizomicrobium sp.]
MTLGNTPEIAMRKAAFEAELAAERAQFGLAERAAKFGYWRQRLTDGHTMWSPGMYRLLNIDESQKPDMAWLLSQILDEDAANISQIITNAIKTRSGFYYRSRPKDPSNPAAFVDTHGEVDIGPDGRVVSVVGVCHDVTKQVIAEAARAAAEDRYRVMTEQASDIIMFYDTEGHILFASLALQNILGRTPAEIETGHFVELTHPDDRSQAQALREKLKPGEVRAATYRVRHRDGHYVWIESNVRGVFDEGSDEPKNIISVSRDVSERKADELKMRAAQQEAEAASRAKSAFLASMSHELRTPLNAIIGFSEIMHDEMFGPIGNARYTEYAGLIQDSGQLLLDLISDILDTAKIEAGKMELNFDDVDLSAIIEDCGRMLAQKARDAGIQMIMEVPEGGLPLTADPRAIKQIILNLLSNALKFTQRGGHVWIKAVCDAGGITLSVRDDGIGIPAESLPRLGRAFEQVATDPMLSKNGTGLGLALVNALAQKHGGKMQIDSIESEGTTVTVTLARTPPAVQAEAA